MPCSITIPVVLSTLLALGQAASHSIDVGEDGLVFEPNVLFADVGDTVTFDFYPGSHSVARSTFDSPCNDVDNGFYSGIVNAQRGESDTTFTINVTDTEPIWYYCPTSDHCSFGMVGVINPPRDGSQTFSDFTNNAVNNGRSTTPQQVYGGVISNDDRDRDDDDDDDDGPRGSPRPTQSGVTMVGTATRPSRTGGPTGAAGSTGGDGSRGDGQRGDGSRDDDSRGDGQRGDGQRGDGQRGDGPRGAGSALEPASIAKTGLVMLFAGALFL